MNEQYTISTREMVVIAAKEVGKTIPILGSVIGAHESIFSAIEMTRVKVTFEEVFRRLDDLEKAGKPQVFDEKACSVLIYGAEQARADILAGAKAKEYGSAIAHYSQSPDDMNEVFEVLDCLRKLSADDLKVLYEFRIDDGLFENRAVADLAGYQAHVNPFEAQATVRVRMERLFPSLMRLQGLGVIYLSSGYSPTGGVALDIGGLSADLRKFAFLTQAGIRLVKVLPR
jgi:hypothetical protein